MCTVVVDGAQKFSGPTPRFLSLLRSGRALPKVGVARLRLAAPVAKGTEAVGTDLWAAGGSRGKRRPMGWGGAGRQAGRRKPLKHLPHLQVSSVV